MGNLRAGCLTGAAGRVSKLPHGSFGRKVCGIVIKKMWRIYMSYRREDCGVAAGRLFRNLLSQGKPLEILTDVGVLPPGVDYTGALQTLVSSCDLVLAVIGKGWASREMFQEGDFIRIEIGTALRRGIPVLPVLVDGAVFSAADRLPAGLSAVFDVNSVQLKDAGDREAAALLLETIAPLVTGFRLRQQEEARRANEGSLPVPAPVLPPAAPVTDRRTIGPAPHVPEPPDADPRQRVLQEMEDRLNVEVRTAALKAEEMKRTVERQLVSQRESDARRQADRQLAQKAADSKLREHERASRLAAAAKRDTVKEQVQHAAESARDREHRERLAREAEAKRRAEEQRLQREAEARRAAEQQRIAEQEREAKRRMEEKEKLLRQAEARIQAAERKRAQDQAEATRKADEQMQLKREDEVRRRAEERQKQLREEEEKRRADEKLLAARLRRR